MWQQKLGMFLSLCCLVNILKIITYLIIYTISIRGQLIPNVTRKKKKFLFYAIIVNYVGSESGKQRHRKNKE